jgi:hypothetical protein
MSAAGFEAGCACGRIGLELACEPLAQFFCHCDDCQCFFGAAYVATAMYARECVRITRGEPQVWVPKINHRHFCRDCGTRLFSEVPGMGVRGVNAYLLPQGSFRPTFHVQCQYASRPVRDTLPHYRVYPAAFGGTDDDIESRDPAWRR